MGESNHNPPQIPVRGALDVLPLGRTMEGTCFNSHSVIKRARVAPPPPTASTPQAADSHQFQLLADIALPPDLGWPGAWAA